MAVMMGNLYRALKEAGVDEERAQKASEEVAGFENRLSGIEGKVNTLTWMVGTNIALTLGVFAVLFRIAGMR